MNHTALRFPLSSEGQSGPQAAPLGIYAKSSSKASQSHKIEKPQKDDLQAYRYGLQGAARRLLPRERVSDCCRKPIPLQEHKGVDILCFQSDEQTHSGSYTNLQRCGSVWMCPVCASKISERRRQELQQGVEAHRAKNGYLLFVTFTLSHHQEDSLPDVWDALKYARALTVSGRWAKEFRAYHHIVGMVRTVEITYGVNGWHPHLHVLYFFEQEPQIALFEQELKARWSQVLESRGKYASYERGVDVRFSDKEITEYVTKWGKQPRWTAVEELTKANTKSGRAGSLTPFAMLHAYNESLQEEDRRYFGALFIAYACVMKGQRQLVWSRGLRDRLGLAVELDDQELVAQQEEHAVVIVTLSPAAWAFILGNDMRGELLDWLTHGLPHFYMQLHIYLPAEWVYIPPHMDSLLQ